MTDISVTKMNIGEIPLRFDYNGEVRSLVPQGGTVGVSLLLDKG